MCDLRVDAEAGIGADASGRWWVSVVCAVSAAPPRPDSDSRFYLELDLSGDVV